jgi:hypothetical protein
MTAVSADQLFIYQHLLDLMPGGQTQDETDGHSRKDREDRLVDGADPLDLEVV